MASLNFVGMAWPKPQPGWIVQSVIDQQIEGQMREVAAYVFVAQLKAHYLQELVTVLSLHLARSAPWGSE